MGEPIRQPIRRHRLMPSVKQKRNYIPAAAAIGLAIVLCLLHSGQVRAEGGQTGCNIAVALDVSGSMVSTDEERLSIEMIGMMIDLGSQDDSIAVVAYNDSIVYNSGLIPMGKKADREQLKANLEQLTFQGETDNGLGLRTAVDILTASGASADKGKASYVVVLSDGRTDLAKSRSDRSEQQSQLDWDESLAKAQENGIQIHTVSFPNEYDDVTSQMTIASTKTGGTSRVVANPIQLVEAMTQIWFACKGYHSIQTNTADASGEVKKLAFDIKDIQTGEVTFLSVATKELSVFEMVGQSNEIELSKSRHYAVAKIKEPVKEIIYAMYACREEGLLLTSVVDSGILPEQVSRETDADQAAKEPAAPHPPRAVDEKTEEELYLSKGKQVYDVSTLFEDADGDIVRYELVMPPDTSLLANLQGSMLEVTPKDREDVALTIVATDAAGLQGEAAMIFHCIPKWKEYYTALVFLVIALILAATAAVCFMICRVLFKREDGAGQVTFSGMLRAAFLDLKSKNEIPNLLFDLQEYGTQEVTLRELLHNAGVAEDLPDLENIHFAPYARNRIRFMHNSQGGVFIGEEPLPQNKTVVLDTGTTIYVSFAENAAEYELRYVAKGTMG